MRKPPLVPPIKCQGIKTKLVERIKSFAPTDIKGRYIEPFLGSGVISLNLLPQRALLNDTNIHIIGFYKALQKGEVTPSSVKAHLQQEGTILSQGGQEHYNFVRSRFNEQGDPHDFLFLNRACFNGVMRFNRKGGFNVPFCHKPDRFAQSYVTKIFNQVQALQDVMQSRDWEFTTHDFREVLAEAEEDDFIYLDPPYAGRHVDYFNSWSATDEEDLTQFLRDSPARWMLSSWQENEFRRNSATDIWASEGWHIETTEHFYHVGAQETLRHPMIEALVFNFSPNRENKEVHDAPDLQLSLL
ncbi:Dam family site-specific DNA-(adenine-N6)-methyltransferase [bacterium]|nr:MAG: Dam family site-specific DNA-(adenine-N6)-methyltransferase [bacterium]